MLHASAAEQKYTITGNHYERSTLLSPTGVGHRHKIVALPKLDQARAAPGRASRCKHVAQE